MARLEPRRSGRACPLGALALDHRASRRDGRTIAGSSGSRPPCTQTTPDVGEFSDWSSTPRPGNAAHGRADRE